MRLYGKAALKERLDYTAAANRLPHAIMLHGERGCGRRTAAKYIAQLFMCGAPPCGSCTTCTRIEQGIHPDVVYAKQMCDGKYSAEKIREVVASAAIKPNDGAVKIYIFEDSDEMNVTVQNTLLKIIEEPASYLRFIFTCENTNNILTTIQSRVTTHDVPTPSPEECCAYLTANGVDAAKAQELSELLSGNIGKCLEVLEDGAEARLMDTARHAAEGIAKRSAFTTAAALSEQSGRAEFAAVLEYLAGILRDALASRCGAPLSSCGKGEAQAIAAAYNEADITNMLDELFKVISHRDYNINLALSASYLTSKLF